MRHVVKETYHVKRISPDQNTSRSPPELFPAKCSTTYGRPGVCQFVRTNDRLTGYCGDINDFLVT